MSQPLTFDSLPAPVRDLQESAVFTLLCEHPRPSDFSRSLRDTYAKRGSNQAGNLVTACQRCNSSRGNRALATFCGAVADYVNHGATGEAILAHVRKCSKRVVPMAEAKALVSRRGSVAKALSYLSK